MLLTWCEVQSTPLWYKHCWLVCVVCIYLFKVSIRCSVSVPVDYTTLLKYTTSSPLHQLFKLLSSCDANIIKFQSRSSSATCTGDSKPRGLSGRPCDVDIDDDSLSSLCSSVTSVWFQNCMSCQHTYDAYMKSQQCCCKRHVPLYLHGDMYVQGTAKHVC
jgi:hypothetical protein